VWALDPDPARRRAGRKLYGALWAFRFAVLALIVLVLYWRGVI
jgi:hypothetical protein